VADSSVATSFPEGGVTIFESVDDRSFWFDHRNWAICHYLERLPVGPFLEVGSGSGVVVEHIQRSTGRPVVSVEPVLTGAVAVARRGVSLSFCGTLETVNFPESSFPAVGAFDVIEHLDDPQAFLGECRRILQKGGRLLVTVPAYQWLWSDFDEWNGHVQRFNLSTLSSLLHQGGFIVEKQTHLFAPLVIPAALSRKVLVSFRKPRTRNELEGAVEHALAPTSKLVDISLRAIHRLERAVIRTAQVPFGTSILAVARAQT
jgi:SAM-dependent methyltransferase